MMRDLLPLFLLRLLGMTLSDIRLNGSESSGGRSRVILGPGRKAGPPEDPPIPDY